MEYYELYEVLKNHFDSEKDRAELQELNVSIESIPFESKVCDLLMAQRNNSATNISKP